MVRLIVLDQLRQMRVAYLMIGALVVAVWLGHSGGPSDRSRLMAFSILLACTAGPMVTFTNLARKEFSLLPVSRRQLWRARWVLGTVIPVAVTSTGAAVVLAMAPLIPVGNRIHIDTFILAALCEFAYLGVISGILTLLARRRSFISTRVDGSIDAVATIVLLGAFFGGEFLLRPYLPIRWTDLGGFTGAALAAGLGLAGASFFHTPGPGSRGLTRQSNRAIRRIAATSPPPRPWLPANGVVAISRIVAGYCAFTVLMVSTILLLPGDVFFEPGHGRHAIFWIIMASLVFIWPIWRPRLRQLRTLPLATWHLNAIFLGTQAVHWLILWAALALLQVVFPARTADVLRPDLIAGLIGVSALSDAYRLQSSWLVKGTLIALALLLIFASVRYVDRAPEAAVWLPSAMLGIIALSAAAWLNNHALTRSNSIYKPDKSALSFAP